MKYTLLFLLLVTVVALSYQQEEPKNPPDSEYYKPLKRFVRQMPPPGMPPPPEMPPPPQMANFEHSDYNRIKRAAKGVGGALPTRKG